MKNLFDKYPFLSYSKTKKIISWFPIIATCILALVGSGLILKNPIKWSFLITGIILSIISYFYDKSYRETLEGVKKSHEKDIKTLSEEKINEIEKIKFENKQKLADDKIHTITNFTQEINNLISHLGEDWNQEKFSLYQANILNTISDTLTGMGVMDVRASLYGITAEENEENFQIIFKKCSKNSRQPRQTDFTVNVKDKYELFNVLKNQTPSHLQRPEKERPKQETSATVRSHGRHWIHSFRFPITYQPTLDTSYSTGFDTPEMYLLIVDTSVDKIIPDFVEDILKLASHLFITSLKQINKKASQQTPIQTIALLALDKQ